uniref:Ras-GAP domain-containing protein n=2 Tax=Neogobius melanostomus TaxID=47308 RepID=A0A8C6U9D6_9GOBI
RSKCEPGTQDGRHVNKRHDRARVFLNNFLGGRCQKTKGTFSPSRFSFQSCNLVKVQIVTATFTLYFPCSSTASRLKNLDKTQAKVVPGKFGLIEKSLDTFRQFQNGLLLGDMCLTPLRYFVEVCLDDCLYARTSCKARTDNVFWGERFDFSGLPSIGSITLHLYKETNPKRRKDKSSYVGLVNIGVSSLTGRQIQERWFPVSTPSSNRVGGGAADGAVQEFAEWISANYLRLCGTLESNLSLRAKDEISAALVHILHSTDFLTDLMMAEVDRCRDNDQLIFRENTLKYLQDALGEFVKALYESDENCEVDPSRCSTSELQEHQANLRMCCELAFCKILDSYRVFPRELKEVFCSWSEECLSRGRGDISERLITASLFLRFLCPAVMSHHSSSCAPNIRRAHGADTHADRQVIQNLANFSKFGVKEDYMLFMNDFVERQWSAMQRFVQEISNHESLNQSQGFEGYMDLGRELSTLHSLLSELDQVTIATSSWVTTSAPLPRILRELSLALANPGGVACPSGGAVASGMGMAGSMGAWSGQSLSEWLVDFTRLPSPTPENKDLFFVTKGSSLQPAPGLRMSPSSSYSDPNDANEANDANDPIGDDSAGLDSAPGDGLDDEGAWHRAGLLPLSFQNPVYHMTTPSPRQPPEAIPPEPASAIKGAVFIMGVGTQRGRVSDVATSITALCVKGGSRQTAPQRRIDQPPPAAPPRGRTPPSMLTGSAHYPRPASGSMMSSSPDWPSSRLRQTSSSSKGDSPEKQRKAPSPCALDRTAAWLLNMNSSYGETEEERQDDAAVEKVSLSYTDTTANSSTVTTTSCDPLVLQVRLEDTEGRLRRLQDDKDLQMNSIITRLMAVEEELKKDHSDMQAVVDSKQKIIEAQEKRILSLDAANTRLMAALTQLKERYAVTSRNGLSPSNTSSLQITENGEFRSDPGLNQD